MLTAPGSGLHKLDAVLRAESLHVTRTKPIDLFVKTSDPKRTHADIVRLGGSVGTISGNVMTARLPRRALAELSDSVRVERLEGSGKKTKRLEKLLPEMKVDQLHAGVGGTSFKGKGVVVGVVDMGLDLTHAAFKTAAGATRVIAAWDQVATTGTKPATFNYGKECTKAQLAANTCTLPAAEMHGTHVTGIAAGSTVGEYSGVAPEADIVFVNTDGGDTQICDAAKYIFAIAAAEGKPAVVNMSLGGHAGPHDGTALEDECLDNLVGPGKIIVAAAGNEGEGSKSTVAGTPSVSVHAQLTAAAAGAKSVRFLPSVKDDAVSLNAHAYFDAPSAVSIRVGAVEGNGTPVFTSAVSVGGNDVDGVSLTVGTHTLGPISITNASFPSGARQFTIEIGDENNDKSELDDVQWILEATGTGKLDAYVDTSNNGGFLSTNASAGVTVDNQQTIGNPAIAKNVLAVASYVTRNAWTPANASLGAQTQPGAVIGARSGFSSQGPARRATVVLGPKPDIAAPGELIASALSVGATEEAEEKIVKAAPNA